MPLPRLSFSLLASPFFLFTSFFILLFLSSCNAAVLPDVVTVTPDPSTIWTQTPPGAVAPLPTFTFGPTLAPVETATPTASPTATPAPELRPLYVIDASMDYEAKTLKVVQDITYPNTSAESLNDILLAVEPNLINSVFALGSVSVNGQEVGTYTLTGQNLDITLPAPLASGESVKLGLSYTLNLPEIVQGDPNVVRPQIFGVAQRQANLADLYPFVAPYVPGPGWVLHNPWFYGWHLRYPLADFDVTLRFSDSANLPVVAASS